MIDTQNTSRPSSVVEAQGLTKQFRGVKALDDVNVRFSQDEIVGVIGPNGAGKSTLFALLTGQLAPSAGTITMDGTGIVGLEPHAVAPLGLVKTFQDARLFHGQSLTVRDNVLVGGYHRQRAPIWSAGLRTPGFRAEIESERDHADELLRLVGVGELADADPQALSYGERRLVEIARALAARPRILLLDEPSAGLNPAETERLGEVLKTVWEGGVGLAVVDHDIPFIMKLAHRVVVLAWGTVIAAGTPEEVSQLQHVRDAYFGAGS